MPISQQRPVWCCLFDKLRRGVWDGRPERSEGTKPHFPTPSGSSTTPSPTPRTLAARRGRRGKRPNSHIFPDTPDGHPQRGRYLSRPRGRHGPGPRHQPGPAGRVGLLREDRRGIRRGQARRTGEQRLRARWIFGVFVNGAKKGATMRHTRTLVLVLAVLSMIAAAAPAFAQSPVPVDPSN